MTDHTKYKIGDAIKVRFGARGSRTARVLSELKTDTDGKQYYTVAKFNSTTFQWLKESDQYIDTILGKV